MTETYETFANYTKFKHHYLDPDKLHSMFITDTTVGFYKKSQFHRLDGPAIISTNWPSNWYINGWYVDDKIEEWSHNQGIDLDNLTEDDKIMIKLTWSDYHE